MKQTFITRFEQHGFHQAGQSGNQLYGRCPFCGKDRFYLNPDTGLWDCKAGNCMRSGNSISFLTQLYTFLKSNELTPNLVTKKYCELKGLTFSILKSCGLLFNPANDSLVLPVFSPEGKLVDLRIIRPGLKVFSTSGCHVGLKNAERFTQRDGQIWLVEGESDYLTLCQAFDDLEMKDDLVVCIPGAGTFKDDWVNLFAGRKVNVLLDHDRAGRDGSAKIYKALQGVAAELRFIHWPSDKKNHFDIRDFYQECDKDPEAFLDGLTDILKPLPPGMEKAQATQLKKPEANHTDISSLLTDAHNAKLLAEAVQDDFVYNRDLCVWLKNNGTIFEPDKNGEIFKKVKGLEAYFLTLTKTHPQYSKEIFRHIIHLLSRAAIENAVALARWELAIGTDAFDKNLFEFNVQNGVVNVKTGSFRPRTRKDRFLKISPASFDKCATCPKFKAMLNDWFPNQPEMIAYLQRAVGLLLTGCTDAQVFFIFYGLGKNGKSVFIAIILLLLGNYSFCISPEALFDKNSSSEANHVKGVLPGIRAAIAMEMPEGRLNVSVIKQLVSQDRISYRPLYGNYSSYESQFKFIASTNHRPVITDTTDGIWRKLRLVPFEVVIPEGKRKPLSILLADCKRELSGILNWALAGFQSFQKNGLGDCSRITAATSAYRSESDFIGTFLSERCEVGKTFSVLCKELFNEYRWFCETGNERALSGVRFSRYLRDEKGFINRPGTDNLHFWQGIQLRKKGKK